MRSAFLILVLLVGCVKVDVLNLNPPSDPDDGQAVPTQYGFIKHFGMTTDPLATNDEWINALATDSNQNIYIAGLTKSNLDGTAAGEDILVRKLDTNGAVQWTYQFSSENGYTNTGNEKIRAINIVNNYIYMTGFTSGSLFQASGGSNDIIFIKMGLDGSVVWTKQLTASTAGPNSGDDQCWSMTHDSLGNLYLGCLTSGSIAEANGGGGLWDAVILKINPADGSTIWQKQIGTTTAAANPLILTSVSQNEFVNSIVTDGTHLYFGGWTKSNLAGANAGGATNGDMFIMKMKIQDQTISWALHYNQTLLGAGKALGDDMLMNLAINSNKLIFTGNTASILGTTSKGGQDCFVGSVAMSDGSGTIINQMAQNSTANDNDCRGYVDSTGNVFVVGTTYGSTAFDTLSGYSDSIAFKFDSSLNLIWGKQFGLNYSGINSTSTWGDYTYSGAVDIYDNFIFSGGTYGSFSEQANNLNSKSDTLLIKLNSAGDSF